MHGLAARKGAAGSLGRVVGQTLGIAEGDDPRIVEGHEIQNRCKKGRIGGAHAQVVDRRPAGAEEDR